MNTQIWLGPEAPDESRFKPVTTKTWKPYGGGLWTSTWDGEGGDWLAWCKAENFGLYHRYPWWLLEVDPAARVFEVDTAEAMERFMDTYAVMDVEWPGPIVKYVDWPRVGNDWDGVHLRDSGLHWEVSERGDVAHAKSMPFYGWDCQSTFWFRWVFRDVRRFKRTRKKRAVLV